MTGEDPIPVRGAQTGSRARRRLIGAGITIAALVAACGGFAYFSDKSPAPPPVYIGTSGMCAKVVDGPGLDTCNTDSRTPGGDVVMAIDQAPAGWNAASARAAGGPAAELETPLLPSAFTFMPSGKIAYNADLLAAEPTVTGQDPVRVVYRIKPAAVWNDGTGGTHPVTAQDFVFAWRTLGSHDPNLPLAGLAGYDLISNVEGSDGGRTVTVTFRAPYGDWRGLFTRLEPYWFAATAAGADPTDATRMTGPQLEKAFTALDKMPKFSAGPFIIGHTGPGGAIVEVPNPHWYGRLTPSLNTITFRPTGPHEVLTALQNRLVNVFSTTPDLDLLHTLNLMPGINYQMSGEFTQEHLQLNAADPFLRDTKLRQAILAAIDVPDLIQRELPEFFHTAPPLLSHNLVPGETGYQDVIRQVAPATGRGDLDAARKLLATAGYTGVGTGDGLLTPDGRHVTITFAHADTPVRDQTAELLARDLDALGITVTDKVSRDMPATLAHRDFGIAELDSADGPLVATTAQRWSSTGAENFTGWSDPESDTLLDQAAREMDGARQAALLNRQDRILTAAAVDLPLYRPLTILVTSAQFTDMRVNAASFATYNTQEWGLLPTAS